MAWYSISFKCFEGTPVDDPELMDEWMDVMKKKQELKEKESKLVLQ